MADLTSTADLSDLAQMADSTIWAGRYSATGATITTPLLQVDTYSTEHTGAIGTREVRKLTSVTIVTPVTHAACLGVISLHPAGWALVQMNATHIQLWQYSSGTWVAVAGALLEATSIGGGGGASDAVSFGNVPTIGPGSLRLEVFGGDVYALGYGSGVKSYVLRGSSLAALTGPREPGYVAGSFPPLIEQTFTFTAAGGFEPAFPIAALYDGQWYVGGNLGHDVTRAGASDWWFNIANGPEPHAGVHIFTDKSRVCAASLHLYSFDPGGAGTATEQVGLWASWDGLQLCRSTMDCLPLAGRDTGGTIWLLGVDAWNAYTDGGLMLGGGIGPAFNPKPSALYRVGLADPAQGCVVSGSGVAGVDGYYTLADGLTINSHDVYVEDGGTHWIVFQDGHWVVIAAPTVTVSGTGTDADQVYTATGDLFNGHTQYLSSDGLFEIVWENGGWVLVAVANPTVPLYADSDGTFPWTDAWTTVGVLVVTLCGLTDADGYYFADGTLTNGRETFVSASGDYEIIWDGTEWVLVAVADPFLVLYQDGTGDAPAGAWIVVNGTGHVPVVVLGTAPTLTEGTVSTDALATDGDSTTPWSWPASGPVTPPGGGEGVMWADPNTDADRPATMVRVGVAVPLADESVFRAVVGTTAPGGTVDWSLYVAAPFGANVHLPEAGASVYLGVIGPTATNVPPLVMVTMRGDTL